MAFEIMFDKWSVGLQVHANMKSALCKKLTLALALSVLALATSYTHGSTQVEPVAALKRLNAQNLQFEQKIVKVTDNVYTAVGFHGANTSMIVGTDGVIIVDTLRGPASAANALKAFREYSGKPVKAILYTHSHGDHIGGASAFVGDSNPVIYATENFGSAEGVNEVVNPVKAKKVSNKS